MATTSLQGAYDQTRRWIETNDPERAVGLAQHILEQYPKNLEAYRILGEAYLASRRLDKAQEAFERVLKSDPENIPAHVGLGIAFERQGKLERAVPEFEQAWEIKPDMAELRSQVLRLYTDAWGSEHAQLRLSRAGLARLYAKGHMLPQAITEFRQVIAEQPQRHDAQVALAEALWRDGQEQEAINLSRDILSRNPDSLKANLLLGYLLLAQGKPEGQKYWEASQEIDPFQTVASAMFETLPTSAPPEPMIEEWDEAAWRRQVELEKQPIPAATRPIPIADIEPVSAPSIPARKPAPAAVSAGNNDDFLAVLLGGASTSAVVKEKEVLPIDDGEPISAAPFTFDDVESPSTVPATASGGDPSMTPFSLDDLGLSDEEIAGLDEANANEPEMAPFSLNDLGLSEDEITSLNDASSEPAAADEPAMAPFSFSDLGLSEDEIASLNDASGEPAAAEEPAMAPFSFSDLGLSEDEIASLNDASGEPAAADEPAMAPFSFSDLGLSEDEISSLNDASGESAATDEPAMTPFSFSDLGLSEDEIASLNDASGESAATDEPTMTPFSFSDLGLSEDEIASLNDASGEPATTDEPAMTPFSFSDLGLSEDEIASLNDASGGQADEPTMTPFSLSDLGLSDEEMASLNNASSTPSPSSFGFDSSSSDVPADLLPFSLDEFDTAGSDGSSLPSSLQPFSLDEAPPEQPRIASYTPPESAFTQSSNTLDNDDDETALPQTGGYSWQQPAQRTRPNYMNNSGERDPLMPEGESIFEKLKQRREKEIDTLPPVETPSSTSFEPEDDRMIFSADNISLRDDEQSENEPELSGIAAAAAAGINESASKPIEEAPVITPAATPASGAEDLVSGLSNGQIQPFSLSDLGLSAEEIAALGLGRDTGEAQSFTSMLGDQPVAPQETSSASTFEESEPFTLPEEPVASESTDTFDLLSDFNLNDVSPAEPATSAPSSADDEAISGMEGLSPFSLSDLGLTEDEIGALGLDGIDDRSGLDITEEELAGLDLGGDIDLSHTPTVPTASVEPEVDREPAPQSSGDPLLDRLLTLGGEQGYVDISDIIAGVENPEAEAERIEEIGRLLHANNIKIFDGDEEVDMDAEYASEDELEDDIAQIDFADASISPSITSEPEMTPFSLADLGLSDDEIASLGLGEPATPASQPKADEPEMTPFSLADLGLSDDDIADLGLGEPATPASQPKADEPEMTPFSLADLGLSDDDIADLGLGEPASQPKADEPEMTPFSLADLGLSDDEIADLGLDEPATPTSQPKADEPEMTPFSLADLGLSDDEIASLGDMSADVPDEVAPTPTAPERPTFEAPVAPPVRSEPEPPQATPVQPVAQGSPIQPRHSPGLSNSLAVGVPALDAYLQRLNADPQNHTLRLSLARISGQIGQTDAALQQYKNIVRQNVMLDHVADDLQDLIDDTDEPQTLQRLHRLLGDVYSKQGRIEQALAEYNWTYQAN